MGDHVRGRETPIVKSNTGVSTLPLALVFLGSRAILGLRVFPGEIKEVNPRPALYFSEQRESQRGLAGDWSRLESPKAEDTVITERALPGLKQRALKQGWTPPLKQQWVEAIAPNKGKEFFIYDVLVNLFVKEFQPWGRTGRDDWAKQSWLLFGGEGRG